MQPGTFSRQDIAVSQEESPGFSRGEDVNVFTQYSPKNALCKLAPDGNLGFTILFARLSRLNYG